MATVAAPTTTSEVPWPVNRDDYELHDIIGKQYNL